MLLRLARVAAIGLLAAAPAAAGPTTPQLSKAQRAVLQAVVAGVDAAAAQPDTPDIDWRTHVMRASDGSHYVAFAAVDPKGAVPGAPVTLYVRLATRQVASSSAVVERSAVMEWLTGLRSDPLGARATRVVTVPTGELPVGGPSMGGRGGSATEASTALLLMDRERQKERQRKADQDAARRAELEQQSSPSRGLYPFEDFDVAATPEATPSGGLKVSRSLTTGPGDYDLYVGWADPVMGKAPTVVHVIKHALHLPPASSSELSLGSIIIADRVGVRAAPYPPEAQAAHPYSIGTTEIVPASDAIFTRDEKIAVAFQVINATPAETGKPDVNITFRIVRVTGDREQPVASLTPQRYHDETLPADFDLRLGHPIFAAVAAPLTTLGRGAYRLKIGVSDLNAGVATGGDVDFRVVGTPASLLAEAPPLAVPFRREAVLDAATVGAVIHAITPARPSAALTRALDLAITRHFVDLIREEPVDPVEQGVRSALTGMALYALGDAASPLQLQRAVQAGAPNPPLQIFIGAARALEGRDADALAAWQAALDGGVPTETVLPLIVNAHLRRGDGAAATALIAAHAPNLDARSEWWRAEAAAAIVSGRERDAVPVLEARLAQQAQDADAQWLLVHALFAGIVRSPLAGAGAEPLTRFARAAREYIDANGPHAALAADWVAVLSPAPPR